MASRGTQLNLILNLVLCAVLLEMANCSPAKPNRTCSDMRCLSGEVCVMEGSCDFTGRCNSYPTCRISRGIKPAPVTCETVRCPPGQFCSLIEERCSWKPCPSRPTCVSTNSSSKYAPTLRPW
ncbi:hypothetical protein L9F63_016493 [Diploptera punctata]|uniref:Uncharacterized protein n=1 Tax=Diploptera punctata TaxID=6984 RepID=A0AAD8A2B1_DIPPU|nr:hypothetical protein L9F63_016493 [Diploptera punctata]